MFHFLSPANTPNQTTLSSGKTPVLTRGCYCRDALLLSFLCGRAVTFPTRALTLDVRRWPQASRSRRACAAPFLFMNARTRSLAACVHRRWESHVEVDRFRLGQRGRIRRRWSYISWLVGVRKAPVTLVTVRLGVHRVGHFRLVQRVHGPYPPLINDTLPLSKVQTQHGVYVLAESAQGRLFWLL